MAESNILGSTIHIVYKISLKLTICWPNSKETVTQRSNFILEMGMYWQSCTLDSDCTEEDPNLVCVLRPRSIEKW